MQEADVVANKGMEQSAWILLEEEAEKVEKLWEVNNNQCFFTARDDIIMVTERRLGAEPQRRHHSGELPRRRCRGG